MKYLRTPFVSLVVLAAAIAGCSQISDHKPATSVPQGSAGMTVHKDPVTGRFVPVPEASALPLSKELSNAMSMSQEGLVEVPAPGGGFMVDLRGRFQQATTATTGADGKVALQCGQHERQEKE
jgi:hypothetical protein